MTNLPADFETIATKLDEVANDPASSREDLVTWLRTAAGLLRDAAALLPAEINYGLDKIEPEGTA
jgi:hypothetical protein